MSANTPRTRTPWTDRVRVAALWLRDTGLGGLGFALVLVVAASGWAASFIGLHAFGMQHMGLTDTTAWLVPITFDGAPAGLSIVVARAATHGRPATVWRLLIIGFTGLSSWINYEHIEDQLGRVVASFMPPSAVILFEGLMSEARAAAVRRRRAMDGTEAAPRLHPARWLFAPWDTLMIVRRYVLWLGLPEGLAAAKAEEWQAPKRRLPWGATKAPRKAVPEAPQSATAPAIAPATATPQGGATGAPGGATVSRLKAPQSAPASATAAPQSAATNTLQGATGNATTPPQSAATSTPQSAPASATAAPQSATPSAPKASRKTTRKPSGTVTREEATKAIRALYDELGRRPVESEMTDLLEEIGSKFTSRQYANKLRGEIELKERHLVALGSTNVTALTGT